MDPKAAPTNEDVQQIVAAARAQIQQDVQQIVEAARSQIHQDVEAIRAAMPPPAPAPAAPAKWSVEYFLDLGSKFASSGVFFIAFGAILLFLANHTMGPAHSAFTFVLVVLGVAVLLYGTGTQGVGQLQSGTEAAKYNVAIAGGAGVLAFAVAFGIIKYSNDMKTAFQIEKKYFLVFVEPNGDGSSTFANHGAQFMIDGVSIPAMRRGDYLIVYVPYVEREKDQKRKVNYTFYALDSATNSLLRAQLPGSFEVEISEGKFERKDASFDFPVYTEKRPVDLRSEGAVVTARQTIGRQQLETVGKAPPRKDIPAATVVTE